MADSMIVPCLIAMMVPTINVKPRQGVGYPQMLRSLGKLLLQRLNHYLVTGDTCPTDNIYNPGKVKLMAFG